MNRSALLALGATLALAACTDATPTSPTAVAPSLSTSADGSDASDGINGNEFVEGQIIVRFRPGAARSEVAEMHRAHKKDDMLLARTEILSVPVGEELAIAAAMSKNPNVEFAEPDYITRLAPCAVSTSCTFPDGQFFGYKWDLNNSGVVMGQPGATPDADMDWEEAYDYLGAGYTGSAVIGILDTGIRQSHQDFTGKFLLGRRFLPDTLTIAGGVNNVVDDHGHGSHVAGIAAARGGSAVPGVAYGANIKLVIAKVCNSAGSCPSSATANAIVWAVDHGANVINMSLGSFGGAPDGSGFAPQQAALQYAASKNVLAVCATGNDDGKAEYSGGIGYPARFPECMAIGATNWLDKKASYSNYGPQIAVSAPGGDANPLNTANSFILSASRNGDGSFAFNAGTSMATPQVAGLAALLYAQGMTSAAAVRQRIVSTVDDIDAPGWDARTGAGRINIYRAITGVSPNAPPVVNPGSYSGHKGVAVQFDGSSSFDPNFKTVTFAWNFGDPTSASNTATGATPTHVFMRGGNYTVTLTVTDAAGLVSTATTIAAIPNIVPAVSALAGATLLQGETYATAGSFADADPDSWTASVDYGDGSGSSALALGAAKGFSLSHRYEAAGAHTVAVTVRDDDSGIGSGTATVTVLTPQQAIASTLVSFIATGLADVSAGNINALQAPLQAAAASLDKGNLRPAINQIEAFKNHVDAMQRSGRMAAASAQDLTARADRVIASIVR